MNKKICVLGNVCSISAMLVLAFTVLLITMESVVIQGETNSSLVIVMVCVALLLNVFALIVRIVIKKKDPHLAEESLRQTREVVSPCMLCISLITVLYVVIILNFY